jgi:hypothetical protein
MYWSWLDRVYAIIEDGVSKRMLYVILGCILLFKLLIAISIWEIPFSWDNWRYIATAHAIYTGNFNALVLSGKPYQSFFTFPVGLPIFIAILRPITSSYYDAGRLLVLLSSLWMTILVFKLFFSSQKTEPLIKVLLFVFLVTFPGMNWITHAIYPESFLIPLIVYGLYRLIIFKFDTKQAVILGILTGIAFLVKPEGALLGVLSVIALFHEKRNYQDFLLSSFWLAALFFLVISPYKIALYWEHQSLLPLITNYHLETYTSQAGNTLLKFIRNFVDNSIFLWTKQFTWIHIGLIPFSIYLVMKSKISKKIVLLISGLIIILILHSRAFGVHYFEQLNPGDALIRYSLIYIPFLLLIIGLSYNKQMLSGTLQKLIALYLILLILFSVRNTIPIAYYYPKGWVNKVIAEEIKNNEHIKNKQPLFGNPEVFSYLEYEEGINLRLMKELNEVNRISINSLIKSDSLIIRDMLGRKYYSTNNK